MALSADKSFDLAIPAENVRAQAIALARIFANSYTQLISRDGVTATERGRVEAWSGGKNGAIPYGFNKRPDFIGDLTALPIEEAQLDHSPHLVRKMPITGLAGTFADVGRLFYMTDDEAGSLTRPAKGIASGWISGFESTSQAFARFFSIEDMMILAMAGNGQYIWNLGTISGISAGGGTFLETEAPHHGRIVETYLSVIESLVGAGADLSVNYEIATVDLAGGVIPWVLADTAGTRKSGTTVTAANVFHEGDVIKVEIAETVAGTAGLANVYARVQMEPGL